MKSLMIASMLMSVGTFAADVNVTWTQGSTPATLGDGAVALTYDSSGRVAKMAVTPTDGGSVRMSGDVILFGENPSVTFAAPGTLVFSNRAEVASGVLTLGSPAEGENNLYYESARTEVLPNSREKATVVFSGASLDDYEPAYANFQDHNPGGNKWWVARELEYEILRPYNAVRATESGVDTLTVQFQGVTRLHANPHTASITVKFLQQGADIAAYTVRASKLYPLDTELGLDIDALADAGTGRAKPVSIKTSDVDNYNLSVIRMRRKAANTHKVIFAGGGIPDADSVSVASDVAVEYSGESTVVCHDDYLPNGIWTTVAKNHKLEELTKVEGFFHTGKNKGVYQTAYNLKARVGYESSQKACQFQVADSLAKTVIGLIVWFRQNGNDIQAFTDQYRSVYVTNRTYNVQYVYLGMDLEQYKNTESDLVWRQVYNSLATNDTSGAHGVKQLRLTLSASSPLATGGADVAIRTDDAIGAAVGGKKTGNGPVTVSRDTETTSYRYEPYLKDNTWTVVVRNRRLCELTRVDGFYHTDPNKGIRQTAYHLRYSSEMGRSGQMTCQFQDLMSTGVMCLRVTLRQNGDNIEMQSNGYSSFYSYFSDCPTEEDKAKLFAGTDFEAINGNTIPKRRTYGANKEGKYVIGESDDASQKGVKELEFFFKEKSDTVTYTLADSSPATEGVTFVGTEAAPLKAAVADGVKFPSNGVVTVGSYADLNITCNTADPNGTRFAVGTNGVLRLNKSQCLTSTGDAIDVIGGKLKVCDELDWASSQTYVNYVTLMNGAEVSGKPIWVGNAGQLASWLVTGDSPSTNLADIVQLAAGNGGVRTFRFYVNDVTQDEATDFLMKGSYRDYGTFARNAVDHWNCFLVKGGAGTMEIEGDIALPNDIDIREGTLKLANSDQLKVSYHNEAAGVRTGITLSGGALELAESTVNATGPFAVTNGASKVVLAAGATLNVPSLNVTAGATLDIIAAEGAVVHSDAELTSASRRRIRLNGEKAGLDENGNVVPLVPGLIFVVR